MVSSYIVGHRVISILFTHLSAFIATYIYNIHTHIQTCLLALAGVTHFTLNQCTAHFSSQTISPHSLCIIHVHLCAQANLAQYCCFRCNATNCTLCAIQKCRREIASYKCARPFLL